jgi:hypothetical protein
MASTVEIANRALSKLGESRITSIEDASKPARAMKARFDHLRDAELAAYPWRFAVVRTTLPASVEVPSWGFTKIYERPPDDLRPLSIDGAYVDHRAVGKTVTGTGYSHPMGWDIIGGKIHTDISAPLKYEYVSQVTNSALFDALFVEALACRLAVDAAEELTQSGQKTEIVARQYDDAIKMARRINALYAPPSRKAPGSFMNARFY